jgi:hypothetical protein
MGQAVKGWAVTLAFALGCGSSPNGPSGAGGTAGGGNGNGGTSADGDGGSDTEGNGGTPDGAGGRRAGGGSESGGRNGTGGREGGDGGQTGGGADAVGGSGGGNSGGNITARDLAEKLGKSHFLIGMGNDLGDGAALTLGVPLDIRYAYLVGLLGQGGWPDWNEGGYFPVYVAQESIAKGMVPMFTLYSMAASGEGNGNSANDGTYMQAYWDGAKLLYQRMNELEGPSLIHFEPDWWAFSQQLSADPTQMPAKVGSLAPDCADLPEDMSGMGRCLVKLARLYSPRTLVGFHASTWASPNPEDTAQYLLAIGAGEADFVVTDMLDRDAGCFEAQAPECTRMDGPWYLDETNQTHPNFNDLTTWAKTITTAMKLPMFWWQIPFGVPSDTPGGTPGRYRDNKVKYLFEHVEEFAAVGGVGALFGTGAGNQTYVTTDGGQFKNACDAYYEAPFQL